MFFIELLSFKFASKDTTFIFLVSLVNIIYMCLQCFDAVGWAAGRASGL